MLIWSPGVVADSRANYLKDIVAQRCQEIEQQTKGWLQPEAYNSGCVYTDILINAQSIRT